MNPSSAASSAVARTRFNPIELGDGRREEYLSVLPFPSDSLLFSPSVNPPSYQYVFTDFEDLHIHIPSSSGVSARMSQGTYIDYDIAYAWRFVTLITVCSTA